MKHARVRFLLSQWVVLPCAIDKRAALAIGYSDNTQFYSSDFGERCLLLEKLSGEERKRAHHVITENSRVLENVQALQRQDFGAFGRLMYASHRSLRDGFEVSIPELDAFVEIAIQSWALGARLTGAGFGGCAIALIRSEDTGVLAMNVRNYFEARGFTRPDFFSFQSATGAEVVA